MYGCVCIKGLKRNLHDLKVTVYIESVSNLAETNKGNNLFIVLPICGCVCFLCITKMKYVVMICHHLIPRMNQSVIPV